MDSAKTISKRTHPPSSARRQETSKKEIDQKQLYLSSITDGKPYRAHTFSALNMYPNHFCWASRLAIASTITCFVSSRLQRLCEYSDIVPQPLMLLFPLACQCSQVCFECQGQEASMPTSQQSVSRFQSLHPSKQHTLIFVFSMSHSM